MNASAPAKDSSADLTFLQRHDFLLRRLHSLSGIVPVGAYMVVHLLTNATAASSEAMFQRMVYQIHSLGPLLPVVEWVFIFIPILFHAIYGVVIIQSGQSNTGSYRYLGNVRYALQRATGMIAFAFIMWHVFHMHGWFHADWWTSTIKGWGGQFKPYSASSTAATAMQSSVIIPILYFIGVLSCVYHLANGLWTAGITWGLWITPKAQRRADYVCAAFGIFLAIVSMGALSAFAIKINPEEAAKIEEQMYDAKVKTGEVEKDSHKYQHPKDEHATRP